MFMCLNYNFSLSYFDIEIDPDPRDLTIITVFYIVFREQIIFLKTNIFYIFFLKL